MHSLLERTARDAILKGLLALPVQWQDLFTRLYPAPRRTLDERLKVSHKASAPTGGGGSVLKLFYALFLVYPAATLLTIWLYTPQGQNLIERFVKIFIAHG